MHGKSRRVEFEVNGRKVAAPTRATLIEAATAAGLSIPHDCTTGQCEACRVHLVAGAVEPGGSRLGDTVLACQARLAGDAAITFDPAPVEMRTAAIVRSLRPLSPDVVEMMIETNKPVPYLPGQSVRLAFPGLPERSFCPTLSLDGLREIETLYFHIRLWPGGALAAALAGRIREGTRLRLTGPYGRAFLRHGEGRLVLVASGTGFAPIWSIAVAARLGQPHRRLTLIASARDPRHLYMRASLDWLAKHGVEDIVVTASAATPMPPAKFGRALAHLPRLGPADTLHAAGAPEMVVAAIAAAAEAGAQFHGLPFLPGPLPNGLGNRLSRLLGARAPVEPVPLLPEKQRG